MAALFANQRALLGVSALSADNFEILNKKVIAMGEGVGTTDKAFADYKTTLVGLWETAKNSLGKLGVLIGKELAPIVSKNLQDFIKWMELNQDEIVKFASTFVEKMAWLAEAGRVAANVIGMSWYGLNMVWESLKNRLFGVFNRH